ncbi:MAG: translocation protein TolB, partial [Moraxella sp.]|nr:translocation protein TolB [Moraxella sp.]
APDGRSFVFTADGGSRTPKLHRYNFNTNQIQAISSGSAASPRFSPDGNKIAYVAGGTLVVIGANGGGNQSIAPSSQHESASFSPNSTRLAYAHGNAITIRSLTTGQSFTKTTQGRVREPAWSNTRR